MEAAGLTAAVAGIVGVKCFGSKTNSISEAEKNLEEDTAVDEYLTEILEEDEENMLSNTRKTRRQKHQNTTKTSSKTELLESNIDHIKKFHDEIGEKLTKVIEAQVKSNQLKQKTLEQFEKFIGLKEREVRLMEREHAANMSSKQLELQIRTLELETLNQNMLHIP